jgi:hypothetical protein
MNSDMALSENFDDDYEDFDEDDLDFETTIAS